MKDVSVILRKVFVQQYYLLNVGFFLLIVTLAFGFMSGKEHKALAEFFIASPFLLLIPISIWTIYLAKVVGFNISRLRVEENNFIFDITLLPSANKFTLLATALTSQFAPASAYAIFLALTAAKYNQLTILALIIASQLLLIAIGTILWYRSTHKPRHEVRVWSIKSWFDKKFTKSLVSIQVMWLLRKEPILVFATKVFSGALLFAVTQLYRTDVYDWRLLTMGIVVASSSNYMIVKQLHEFDTAHFLWLRNMPIPIISRMWTTLVVIATIAIPEISVVVKNFPSNLNLVDLLSAAVLFVTANLYYYSLNFLSIPEDKFGRWLLGSVIVGVLLTLFSIPAEMLAVATFLMAFVIARMNFFSYQSSTGSGHSK